MSLTFEPVWSWPLTTTAIVLLLLMVAVTYPQRVRHLPVFTRRMLVGLRLAAALVLAIAMLRPALQFRETDRQPSILYILTDASRSMTTQDGPGGITRREALLKTLQENEKRLKKLGKEAEIRFFDFADVLARVDNPSEEANGNQSAIGAALKELASETQTGRLAGIVLMSDGAQRALAGYDADPRNMASRFGELRVPIYTVGYGGSGYSDSTFDIAVEDLQVDPLAFSKKTVVVNARLRVLGAAGRRLTVRLLVEDRAGRKRGESGELKVPNAMQTGRGTQPSIEIVVKDNQSVIPIELSWIPQLSGEFKIAVDVEPLDGELKQGNNRLETIISVQKGGINIAYFDIIRPEQTFIRNINRSDKIQLDFLEIRRGKFANRNQIDDGLFSRGKYDAYIIGDVPADVFTTDQLKMFAQRVQEGAGLLMTGGFHNFGAGGYAETPLADVIPVRMRAIDRQQGNTIDPGQQHLGQLQMLPTSVGLTRFIMRLDSPDKNMQRWRGLPPMQGATKLQPKNDFVEVLAETADGIPLLFVADARPARVAAFAGDTTRLWYQHGFQDEHQRFWRQMILWLSRKEQDTNDTVWANVEPRNYSPKQPVVMTFGARNKKGLELADAKFRVEVHNPADETLPLVPRKDANENSAEYAATDSPGDYWVRVRANQNDVALPDEAWTRFIVDARDLEMDHPAADLALLEEIAQLTGGYSIPPEEFGEFLDAKIESGGLSPELTIYSHIRLWDRWPLLLVFVTLMSVEWYFRKKRGLV